MFDETCLRFMSLCLILTISEICLVVSLRYYLYFAPKLHDLLSSWGIGMTGVVAYR